MIIDRHEQGTPGWLEARCGVVTGSEMDNLVTPLWKIRTGKEVDSYLATKLAEWWGGPLAGFSTFATDQGTMGETNAVAWYQFTYDVTVERCGLILRDDGAVGCSPDGLIPNGGLEIKCPQRPAHIKYLLAGEVPPQYRPQVQTALFVTGRPFWDFVSYSRGLPALVLRCEPDPTAQEAIEEALNAFLERFQAAKERLIELNGGEGPPKRIPFVPSSSPEARQDDIMP